MQTGFSVVRTEATDVFIKTKVKGWWLFALNMHKKINTGLSAEKMEMEEKNLRGCNW